MPSRKKANGRARRRRAAEKSRAAATAQNHSLVGEGGGGVQMQMHNMIDAVKMNRDGDGDGSVTNCDHGLVPSHYHWKSKEEFVNTSNNMKQCQVFLQAFVEEFDEVGGDFLVAYHATKGKYANLWKDFAKMSFVVSFLLGCGTSKVLEGNTKSACKYAALGSYFEHYVEVDLLNTRAFPNWCKIRELYSADMHTLVSFFRKRIPCSCLDKKYKEVKYIPKIGLCCNPGCSLPSGKTERSLKMCCSRCRAANYCSRKCQVAIWPCHKGECTFYADLKAKFESKQE